MKNYRHLLSLAYNAPLMIEPAKLQVIIHFLEPQSGLVLVSNVPEQYMAPQKPSLSQQPPLTGIAVVEVMGSLVHRSRTAVDAESGLRSYEDIGRELKAAAVDSRVAGILLRMDSPGGEVAGAYELARTVREVAQAKPIWTVVDGMGLSAGYLIASQTQKILLGTHASVGSIGVIMIHLDQSKADEQQGKKYSVLKRGARKDDFNPHAPLSEGAIQFADKLLDREYDLFVEAVAEARKLPEKKIRATEAGIVYDEDAIDMGLADGQANIDEAVSEMFSYIDAANKTTVSIGGITAMAEPTAPTTLNPSPAALPVTQAEPTVTAAANTRTVDDYEQIALLCRIARKPHLVAQFISERKSVAEVRELLLANDAAVDSESEVFSAFTGQAGVAQSLLDAKPKVTLAQLMKRRLGIQQEAR